MLGWLLPFFVLEHEAGNVYVLVPAWICELGCWTAVRFEIEIGAPVQIPLFLISIA